jgi:hypothetical protein
LKVKNDDIKKDQSKSRSSDDKKEYTAVIVFDREVFIVCEEDFINLTRQDSTWIVDSVALFHVTSTRDLFTFYKEGDYSVVRMDE